MIGLPIVIEIDQSGDLISSQHQNLFFTFLAPGQQSERLTQTAGDPLPGQFIESSIETVYSPYIAIPCRDGSSCTPVQEVKISEAHPGLPWVLIGPGDAIHFEGKLLP